MARQQIHHHAVAARVEVLHNDEGHAVDRRKRVQELPARVKAAGRGANRHDRKICATADGGGLGYPARPLRHSSMRTTTTHSVIFSRGSTSMGTLSQWLSHFPGNDDGAWVERDGSNRRFWTAAA